MHACHCLHQAIFNWKILSMFLTNGIIIIVYDAVIHVVRSHAHENCCIIRQVLVLSHTYCKALEMKKVHGFIIIKG